MIWLNLKNLCRIWLAAGTSWKNFDSISFREEEWDNLVILDGCRFDAFRDVNPFDKHVERRLSNSSHSIDFVWKNFRGLDNSHIVYVSASPQLGRFSLGCHEQIDVWQREWDEELGTVHPRDVVDYAVEAVKKYPDKKIVVHFMQPHYPFIGEKRIDLPEYNPANPGPLDFLIKDELTVWQHLDAGNISLTEVKEAYRSNLKLVLSHVKNLLPYLNGRTVISADHGNLFCKRVGLVKISGHGLFWGDKELAEVPWLVFEDGERKTVKNGSIGTTNDCGKEVKARLKALGYRA